MYVLIDIEWVQKNADIKYITQIAASRVDEVWESTAQFSCLVSPGEDQICDWRHVAYNGYFPVEFLDGCTERECVKQLMEFIEDDDTLCVWSQDSKDILCEKYRLYNGKELPNECICVSHRVRSAVRRRGIEAPGMYQIAKALGIKTPKPKHCAVNDISVLGAILSSVDIEQEEEFVEEEPQEKPQAAQAPQPSPTPKKIISKQERNAEILKKVSYNFVFTPNSPVFHRPSCKVMLRANDILGSVYYKTVIKKRRPCKLCFPDPIEDGTIFEEKIPQPKIPAQKEAPQNAPKQKPQDKIVTVKLLGNNRAHVPKSKLVGCCHYALHPGKLTEEIMMRHNCIKKKCKYFEKYENSPYWNGGKKTPVEDSESKRERKSREQRARQMEDALEEKRALFQSYADALEHDMFIVSVERLSKRHYMAYYVSENSFADEDMFLDLLDTISYFFPKRWIEIQHVQEEGKFVTIDEYMSRSSK